MLTHDAVLRFIEGCQARRLSDHTISDYSITLRKFTEWLEGNPDITCLTSREIASFLASRVGISAKTLLNYHTALSALWQWLKVNGYCAVNIVRLVAAPRPETREILPLSRAEVVALLEAASAGTQGERDRSIILTLLDTGVRASELCELRVKNVDLVRRVCHVFGKGKRERLVVISDATSQAMSIYLKLRRRKPDQAVYLTSHGQAMDRHTLRLVFRRLQDRAAVCHVHPHRFRHTFAINYLRNGGNIFTLQRLLGHTQLDMVKRYLAISQTDIELDHLKASPVTGWSLPGSGP